MNKTREQELGEGSQRGSDWKDSNSQNKEGEK